MAPRNQHTCHLPGCKVKCPPAHLLCRAHWFMVPRDLQFEVYDTVDRRGELIDASWAPWWRAQAEAIAAVLRAEGRADEADHLLANELVIADKLEGGLEGSRVRE